MDNNTEENFVFGSDDDGYHDDIQSQRLDKLGLKVTMLTILVPTILIIIIVFIYMDMKDKVVQVHNSGTTEVQQSADELKKLIDDLKGSQSEFEKRLNSKIEALEKSLSPMEKRVEQHQKDVAYLSNIKIDKKALDAEIKPVSNATEALKKDISTLTDQNKKLVTIAQELQARINEIPSLKTSLESQKASVESLKTTVEGINKNMVNANDLATELKKQKAFYKLELNTLSQTVDKKIDAVKKSIPSATPSGSGGPQ